MQQINNFRKSLQFVLKWEGGYHDDPNDPGGATKWGISQRAHPDLDIANLTPEQAASIYASEYWDTCSLDALPYPYCTVVFDSAVNVGVNRAVKWLKIADTAATYLDLRQQYYVAISNTNVALRRYMRGWLARVADLRKLLEVESNNPEAQSQDQPYGGSLG